MVHSAMVRSALAVGSWLAVRSWLAVDPGLTVGVCPAAYLYPATALGVAAGF
jgi:hypothetical protein